MNGLATPVINGQSIPKRRAVASLSPAKKRPPLDIATPNRSDHCRPSPSSRRHTKSSNLQSGCRPPTKLPPLPRRMIALSQEETCLVSAAGDVMVSRGREFAQLLGANDHQYGNLNTTGSNLSRTGSMGWCDLECSKLPLTLEKSALCNPWLSRLGGQREEKKEDDRASQEYAGLRGGSTYEWTTRTADLHNGAWSMGQVDLDMHATGTAAAIRPPQHSPSLRLDTALDANAGPVLSMPSFDYSHFGAGGNDMLPTSPHRPQTRRRSDLQDQCINPAEARDPENVPTNGTQDVRNTSAPSHPGDAIGPVTPAPPLLFHGVPTFLSSLSQVRIQQVSAHPQGSHVLMISTDALLFSYGLNDHGQLGIGVKSKGPGSHNRYVWTPTIITPLLENGGKAITCAAGESHSLVVVSTEGRRVLKAHSPQADPSIQSGTPPSIKMNRVSSSPPSMNTERENSGNIREKVLSSASASESVWHHQLYGFGRNNSMKIGLIHPRRKGALEQSIPTSADSTKESQFESASHQDDMADVLLPHRVALHCTVWPDVATNHVSSDGGAALCSTLPQGIFALAASSEHSAALVRRATGSVELYTWGNAVYHALGLTKEEMALLKISKRAPVPTLIKSLSLLEVGAPPMHSNSHLQQSPPEFPVDVALGPYSSFVVTSKGRCLSFGISYDGMLGQGSNVVEAKEPKALQFPRGASPVAITSVSAGASHVLSLARDGTVFSWGKNTDGRLGFGQSHAILRGTHTEALESEQTIQWSPSRVPRVSTGKGTIHANMPPKSNGADESFVSVVQVCAGLDCSIFVTESGKVFSCGKHSGRLGLGECERDVYSPTPLFGGLSLWHRPTPHQARPDRPNPSPPESRRLLKRGLTTG
jgi:alpha-tubulin suppressor-like RCC1 family protein